MDIIIKLFLKSIKLIEVNFRLKKIFINLLNKIEKIPELFCI